MVFEKIKDMIHGASDKNNRKVTKVPREGRPESSGPSRSRGKSSVLNEGNERSRRNEDLSLPSEDDLKDIPQMPDTGKNNVGPDNRNSMGQPSRDREQRNRPREKRARAPRENEAGRTGVRNQEQPPQRNSGSPEEMLEEVLRKLDDIDRKLDNLRRR